MNSNRPTTNLDALVSMDTTGDEVSREYAWTCPVTGREVSRSVDAPVSVEYRLGGTTHRVTDANDVTHVLPAPGYFGCVVRIKNRPDV